MRSHEKSGDAQEQLEQAGQPLPGIIIMRPHKPRNTPSKAKTSRRRGRRFGVLPSAMAGESSAGLRTGAWIRCGRDLSGIGGAGRVAVGDEIAAGREDRLPAALAAERRVPAERRRSRPE